MKKHKHNWKREGGIFWPGWVWRMKKCLICHHKIFQDVRVSK